MAWYDDAAVGTPGQTSGATQACYEYHLGVAAGTGNTSSVHCSHAAGNAVCVGTPTNPLDTAAMNFCLSYFSSCGGIIPSPFSSVTECALWYDAAAVGVPGQKAGATQACYDYHLAVAIGTGNTSSVHCLHANGMAPCTGEEPTVIVDAAYNFCKSYSTSCALSAQFESMGECITWYNNASTGIAGETSGASQACYDYHLGVAAGSGNPASIHCMHAKGGTPCTGNASGTVTERSYNFCKSYEETCAQSVPFQSLETCMMWYDDSEVGVPGQTDGATQGCYDYHLGVAAGGGGIVHCEHAKGTAVCVGNSTNPDNSAAVNFCESFATSCTANPFDSDLACQFWYTTKPTGVPGQKSGGTQSCYDYHLSVAIGSGDTSSQHCLHAAGADPCTGEQPKTRTNSNYNFCSKNYPDICSDAILFNNTGECMLWYSSESVGVQGQKAGASQSCFDYHLSVAAGLKESIAIYAATSGDDDSDGGATAAIVIVILILIAAGIAGYFYRENLQSMVGIGSKSSSKYSASNSANRSFVDQEETYDPEPYKPNPYKPALPTRPISPAAKPAMPARPVAVARPSPAPRPGSTSRKPPPQRTAPKLDFSLDDSEI